MQPAEIDEMFAANKDAWNKRTGIHKSSAFYDVASFKAGASSLNDIELKGIGDVAGKSLLHLQCHFGMDTLSWARKGAIATGVDFSEDAIAYARELSKEIAVDAEFVCCNVYDAPQHIDKQFDIVFTSYGVIGWLPDLTKWAAVINHFLKPGGIFFMAEFHPVVWMMDENFEKIKYHYHNHQVITEEVSGTYTDREAPIEYKDYSWNHSLSEVINSLLDEGFQLQQFNEYTYSYYNCFNNVVQGQDGYWRVKGLEDKLPMMYSVKAIKV